MTALLAALTVLTALAAAMSCSAGQRDETGPPPPPMEIIHMDQEKGISAPERECIRSRMTEEERRNAVETREPSGLSKIAACLEYENQLRLFLRGTIEQTGTLSRGTSECLRAAFADADIPRLYQHAQGAENREQTAAATAAGMVALECLNSKERNALTRLNLTPQQWEELTCAVKKMGGRNRTMRLIQQAGAQARQLLITALLLTIACGSQEPPETGRTADAVATTPAPTAPPAPASPTPAPTATAAPTPAPTAAPTPASTPTRPPPTPTQAPAPTQMPEPPPPL